MQPWSGGQNSFFKFFFSQTHNCNFLSCWHLWRESAPWGYFCFWFHWCILLCYFYHSIMCCPPFLSSLLNWRAGKEKEYFTVVGKRMSNLMWRCFRLCACSGGLTYHNRTSLSHCQLLFIIIVYYVILCIAAVPVKALLWTWNTDQYLCGIEKDVEYKKDTII